jgi:hypothetical protein
MIGNGVSTVHLLCEATRLIKEVKGKGHRRMDVIANKFQYPSLSSTVDKLRADGSQNNCQPLPKYLDCPFHMKTNTYVHHYNSAIYCQKKVNAWARQFTGITTGVYC